jgi:hypothetical protein
MSKSLVQEKLLWMRHVQAPGRRVWLDERARDFVMKLNDVAMGGY